MFDVREHMAEVIEDTGLKQKFIAKRMGLRPQQLSDIVHKRRKMEAGEFLSFCEATGTTPLKFYAKAVKESGGE